MSPRDRNRGGHRHHHNNRHQPPQAAASEPAAPAKPTHRRIENIFVAVDACAELGGMPFKVLESLQELYALNGRRKLTVIDTEQGFHEKANGTTPQLFKATGAVASSYGRFIISHPEWTKIIPTKACTRFRQKLAHEVFPVMVTPLIRDVETIGQRMREEAFKIMQARGQSKLMGKQITKPSDIELQVEFFVPGNGGKSHYVFRNDVLSKAADAVMPEWVRMMNNNPAYARKNKLKEEKGTLADMISAVQELKATAYTLCCEFKPELAKQMGKHPQGMPEGSKTLPDLRDSAHLYDQLTLPDREDLWSIPEFLQAARLTHLWPWAQKPILNTLNCNLLNDIHKNTADASYLDLYANEMHKIADPANTLFVLVTHDAPLIQEFLECSTGIRHSKAVMKSTEKGKGGVKHDVFTASNVHERLGLSTDRTQYPKEAPFTGKEFVEFAYKEVLAELGKHIRPRELNELYERVKHPEQYPRDSVSDKMLQEIKRAHTMPMSIRQALTHCVQQTANLEVFTNRDIEGHALVARAGAYRAQKNQRNAANHDHGIL